MKRAGQYLKKHLHWLPAIVLGTAFLCGLLLYKLASLTGGLSAGELAASRAPVGWHGIYNQPFDLPINLARSVVFFAFPDHGQLLTRLPNVLFGGLSVVAFAWLVRLWHGTRPAVLATLLFTTSAWVLHVSRVASFDVLYLWGMIMLLLIHVLLQKHATQPFIWYGSVIIWGLLLYVPGFIWLVLLSAYLNRQSLTEAWQYFALPRERLLYALAGLVWLPLLIIHLIRPGQFLWWLGLPVDLPGPLLLIKQLVAVPVHLFVRGPQYPDLWLSRLPLLDAFTLVCCLIGIYFYVTHRQIGRGRLLGIFLVGGAVLVGLGGPVSLSLLVPILYIAAGTGIAYLLHDWLRVFPLNPLARGLGVGLIVLAVGLSCLYNLRAYFVAWPHNQITQSTFRYHP